MFVIVNKQSRPSWVTTQHDVDPYQKNEIWHQLYLIQAPNSNQHSTETNLMAGDYINACIEDRMDGCYYPREDDCEDYDDFYHHDCGCYGGDFYYHHDAGKKKSEDEESENEGWSILDPYLDMADRYLSLRFRTPPTRPQRALHERTKRYLEHKEAKRLPRKAVAVAIQEKRFTSVAKSTDECEKTIEAEGAEWEEDLRWEKE